jgi:hypothetical protein
MKQLMMLEVADALEAWGELKLDRPEEVEWVADGIEGIDGLGQWHLCEGRFWARWRILTQLAKGRSLSRRSSHGQISIGRMMRRRYII